MTRSYGYGDNTESHEVILTSRCHEVDLFAYGVFVQAAAASDTAYEDTFM